MGLLAVQRGAMIDRLRRFFGVVGAFKGSIDETLSPVAQVADLTGQPYDTSAERFVVARRVVADGIEARYRIGLLNDTSTLIVVDRMQLQSNRLFSLLVGSPIVGGFGSLTDGRSRDMQTLNEGGFETGSTLAPRPVAVHSFYNILAVADLAVAVWSGEAGVPYDIPVGFVLAPGQCMYAQLEAPIAANDYVSIRAWGRIMNDPSLSVQP